ncbi:MAG: hypothetical protein KC478_06125 [Bacteriovoracaceae bacterium]|nr:hypothetical protein [Bacteriovoracaceae bacterium]
MKAYSLLLILFISLPSHADGLLDGISNLADPYRSGLMNIINNLSSSSKGNGIQKSLSKSDCRELLLKEKDEKSQKTLHNVIYFLSEFEEQSLYEPYDLTPACKTGGRFKDYKIGLRSYNNMKVNSYSDSILTESRCMKYLSLDKVEVVKIKIENEQKDCRRMSLGLEDEKFFSFFCVGDNYAYVDYMGLPVEVVEEVPFKNYFP